MNRFQLTVWPRTNLIVPFFSLVLVALMAAVTHSTAIQAQENNLATGAPTITGTAQVGETLTADTSGIADTDGLTNVSYSYQWVANDGTTDADIADATDSTYTLLAADEGKTIKIRVPFTDDAANEESLTSAATGAVAALPPSHITVEVTQIIIRTSGDEEVFTDFAVTWSDLEDCSSNYNAYLNALPGNRPGHETPGSQFHLGSAASDASYIETRLADVQGPIEGFNVEVYCGTNESGRLVSRVLIPSSFGQPSIGTYSSEPPLSALNVSHGTLTPSFNSYTDRYTVTDVANTDTRITITATPKTGYAVAFFEASDQWPLGMVAYSPGPGGGPTGISDECDPRYGDRLGPLPKLTDADPDTTGFQVDLYDGENHVYIRVFPTAYCTTGEGYLLTIKRAEGSVSLVRPNRPATGGVSIRPDNSRGPWPGLKLSAYLNIRDRDELTNATYTYQWLADDAEIAGATKSKYKVKSADLGKTLKVRVSLTDDRGAEEQRTSLATQLVKLRNRAPTGKPIIRGTSQVGQTLRANLSGLSDPNGMTNATLTYEWINTYLFSTGVSTNSDEYTLLPSDVRSRYIWLRVTYTDDAGHEQQVDSDTIETVSATVPGAPESVAVEPARTGTLDITWQAPESHGGSAVTGYKVQGKLSSDSWEAATDVSEATVTGTSHAISSLQVDVEYAVRVIATNSVGDGPASIEVTATPVAQTSQQRAATQNNFATGAPTITGTAQVGEVLSAEPSGVADEDGIDNATFSYQWIQNDGTADADIQDATEANYTLVNADEGKSIKVRVSFTDDASNAESLTSAGTAAVKAANTPATGAPTISGIVQVGHILTASVAGIVDADGLTNVSYSYLWLADDTAVGWAVYRGAMGPTYPLQWSDNGTVIKVRVTFTDDAGNEETVTSGATAEVSAIWTATLSVGSGEDGEGSIFLGYTIFKEDWGAISPSYFSLDGKSHSVSFLLHGPSGLLFGLDRELETSLTLLIGSETFTTSDASCQLGGAYHYSWEEAELDWTAGDDVPVALVRADESKTQSACNRAATGSPTISGTAQVDETLTAGTSGITDGNGLTNANFSYQWLTDDLDRDGATGSTYTLVADDEGKTVKVRVSFTDDEGYKETLTSAATASVSAAPSTNSAASGAPTVTGTAQVGEALTAGTSGITDANGLENVSYTYQWIRVDTDSTETDISGATGSTYTLVAGDQGKTIKVRVSFTDDADNSETLTSAATAAVAQAEPTEPPPAPTNLSAVVNSDGSVTLTWDAPDDDSITGYQILRRRPSLEETTLLVYVNDTGSTSTSYTDTNVTAGIRHVYRVKAINAAGLSNWSNYVRAEP